MEKTERLNLLGTLHFVLAGILALFSCFPLIHVILGTIMLLGGMKSNNGNAPPAFIGLMFIIIGSLFIFVGQIVAVLVFLCGKKLKKRVNPIFCLVIACVECAFMPLGTILGVFTLLALTDQDIKVLFEKNTMDDPKTLDG